MYPSTPDHRPQLPDRESKRRASERPHVLIAGDDPDLSSFLSEGLLLGGFWVSVIASGIQVLEVFRLRTFDLVVVDATLKGLGAIELIRRLRASSDSDEPLSDVPVIVIAGSGNEIDPAEVADVGGDGVILPPIDIETLIPTLFGIVDEWRGEHPGRPWADQAAQSGPQ